MLFSLNFRKGHDVVAKMELQLDRSMYDKGRSLSDKMEKPTDDSMVENLLETSIKTGKVGALTLDPEFFVFESTSCK